MHRISTLIICILTLSAACMLPSGSASAAIHIDHGALNRAIASQQASGYLESLYQSQQDNGVKNFTPMSLLLITASKQLLADGDLATAQTCAVYARRFSPDFPPAVMHEYYISWKANPLMVHRLLIGAIRGYQNKFYTLDDFSAYAFSQLAIVGSALMLTLAGFGLMVLIRNFRLLAHDVRHALPAVLPVQASMALLVLLCVLPLLIGLSIPWLFTYWLMLFWSYHTVRERVVISILSVMFIVVIPLIAAACSYFIYMPQSEPLQLVWQVNYGYYTSRDIERIEQYVVDNPDDYELGFTAALVNKREQNYATALSYYNRLLKNKPRDYRVITNAGNVYFAMGEWDKAVEKYKTAIAAAPQMSAAAHFNLARAYQQKFMFKDAEQSLIAAKRLDSPRIEAYLRMYSENFNRLLIDETVTRRAVWMKGLGEFLTQRNLLNSVWDMLFAGLRLPYGTAAVLALLLLNLMFGPNDTFRIAAKCTLCGKLMCRRCHRNIAAEVLCFQCQNFLKKQDQLSFKQKDAKKNQIFGYVRTVRSWVSFFSIFFPGMAHAWKGRIIQGCMFSFIFFWLLFQAVFAAVFESPWHDLALSRNACVGFYAVLACIAWFALRSHVRTVRSAEIEDNVVLMSFGRDA